MVLTLGVLAGLRLARRDRDLQPHAISWKLPRSGCGGGCVCTHVRAPHELKQQQRVAGHDLDRAVAEHL